MGIAILTFDYVIAIIKTIEDPNVKFPDKCSLHCGEVNPTLIILVVVLAKEVAFLLYKLY